MWGDTLYFTSMPFPLYVFVGIPQTYSEIIAMRIEQTNAIMDGARMPNGKLNLCALTYHFHNSGLPIKDVLMPGLAWHGLDYELARKELT